MDSRLKNRIDKLMHPVAKCTKKIEPKGMERIPAILFGSLLEVDRELKSIEYEIKRDRYRLSQKDTFEKTMSNLKEVFLPFQIPLDETTKRDYYNQSGIVEVVNTFSDNGIFSKTEKVIKLRKSLKQDYYKIRITIGKLMDLYIKHPKFLKDWLSYIDLDFGKVDKTEETKRSPTFKIGINRPTLRELAELRQNA